MSQLVGDSSRGAPEQVRASRGTDLMRVLYCNCSYSPVVPDRWKREVLPALVSSALDVVAVPDLCELAMRRDPLLKELAEADELTIVACHPRAVHWLFHWGGASLEGKAVTVLNMRCQSSDEVLTHLLGDDRPTGRPAPALEPPGVLVPWFPVIDYDRCTHCRQCLEFCLFGVYERDEGGKVIVAEPERCKTNCPACARLCPEVALIFPKADECPINGAEVVDEELERAKVKVNMERILGDDVYAALARRRAGGRTRLLKADKPGDPT
ncbi:MAG: hypothetical protein COZ06_27295 [Armatimonadetes bacterium CG_4_10_14_3_um_filter_66_18]|nr:MAG: hypothetical protein AUJ96_03260 [Armatimonadetes bacterium CG2_30_66_41]PIU90896.1 MAG: hypothetical protein COS65_23840 [Armatimonadetes bacterium CG06_land_8_20_14_3_00_66_21]PIY41024.1 MAG: hypothetical protein COZ06_27295 [Armatimonadetes bacterium CG_4_10_14_3_um_filter_66_18]PIZ49866.1 MAG: hypothetical protein COY42_03010 [Armatimonadetes bacterium CG_4_10_14_0_8_um_filter_66_14]PJB72174.1 MAG: hypothetical protein CO096_08370 [Armatimonadetes bacterium CG_4_9_14_3_um_filter_66_